MPPSSTADTTNEAASIAIATGAVRSWMSQPPTPNPTNSAAELLPVSVAFASTSRSRPITVGRKARSAVSKNVVRIAAPNATTTR